MTAKTHWTLLALFVCAIGLIVIDSGVLESSDRTEPRRLPDDLSSARKAESPGFERLRPLRGEDVSAAKMRTPSSQTGVRLASHHVTMATVAVTTVIGQANSVTGATLSFTDIDNSSQSQTVTEDAEVLARPKGKITLTGTMPGTFRQEHSVVALIGGVQRLSVRPGTRTFSLEIPKLADGVHKLGIFAVDKDGNVVPDVDVLRFALMVRTARVHVLAVDASGLTLGSPPYQIKVTFDTSELATIASNMFQMNRVTDTGTVGSSITLANVQRLAASSGVEIVINQQLDAGLYRLRIVGGDDGVKDRYGNVLQGNDATETNFDENILKPVGAEVSSVQPGIAGATGQYVPYAEFTGPRTVPDGFNPNDKVESRVVRLYYYRDAHRVAQIINRKVRSYNRAGVDMQRQLADKARTEADQRTVARQQAERNAIIQSQNTRRKENELQAAEQSLSRSVQELTNYRRANPNTDPQTDATVQRLESLVRSFENRVGDMRAEVAALRDREVRANEAVQQAEAGERLAREDQFRMGVAAGHADPDTYAPGVPKSDDPVEQVSVSVIGEGLIHLRGPLKGINIIRTMIDQIDQPVGQVRVAVHTVQINGEKENRMEDVAHVIQLYIDHARFLTMQSSEMLRKAVVQVASRKAEETMGLCPGESQEDRDRRYLNAFFGKEFIDELAAMDSEFLKTGNKLLSLHSMDTTSLSSALNLLALAKNSTRLEILQEFDQMIQGELPLIEASYLEAGMTACKKKWSFRCPPKFYPMADRARFESLRGFFNAQIAHDDTMTPLQRDFIRLAQIFKSRLITELEYKQRVMERAIIEDRLGNRIKELVEAKEKEEAAKQALADAHEKISTQRVSVVTELSGFLASAAKVVETFSQYDRFHREKVRKLFDVVLSEPSDGEKGEPRRYSDENHHIKINVGGRPMVWGKSDTSDGSKAGTEENAEDAGKPEGGPAEAKPGQVARPKRTFAPKAEEDKAYWHSMFYELVEIAKNLETEFQKYRFSDQTLEGFRKANSSRLIKLQESVESDRAEAPFLWENQHRLAGYFKFAEILMQDIRRKHDTIDHAGSELLDSLRIEQVDMDLVYRKWVILRDLVAGLVPYIQDASLNQLASDFIEQGEKSMRSLLPLGLNLDIARRTAEQSRRPLDHKKFLDMLIDDLEEKYIELLDGTRAHTANVDNYLKRLTTALDDDFNTQFYHPAFRYIRQASSYHDVQFGQTETTSILANNREFAKVDPSATMEFDLPARDIALAEALNGAKATIDDIGALANDPTFLALASGGVGSAAAPAPGSTGGFGVVRDVLPGLDSTTSEQIMAQNAGARPQFGSNLENLIPDPAIYKFETGTGYEIRPVIQPDGQAVVFDFNYMYTTNIREPVRADEKHLGRVKRHFVHTDVQLSNFELREVSRYTVALKAARTRRGVPLLEDIPVAGVLFRPLPSDESSLQQNLIYSQATIFPTLFDLMGLRWAPAVADMDPLRVSNREFVVRGRHRALENRVYDYASEQVDEFLRIPEANRRADLYRSQETIPYMHPNGYQGPGLDLRDSQLQEGYQPGRVYPQDRFIPGESKEGSPFRPRRG
ncbi:MAG: hypothetical protein H8E44_28405 [Planctomycetes bacterium]|nr:hypothetical protein [Planctomycetota bacterium]